MFSSRLAPMTEVSDWQFTFQSRESSCSEFDVSCAAYTSKKRNIELPCSVMVWPSSSTINGMLAEATGTKPVLRTRSHPRAPPLRGSEIL